jgi:hypothetical protein
MSTDRHPTDHEPPQIHYNVGPGGQLDYEHYRRKTIENMGKSKN